MIQTRFLNSKMSSLIQQFSGRKRENPVWQFFEEKADMRKSKMHRYGFESKSLNDKNILHRN